MTGSEELASEQQKPGQTVKLLYDAVLEDTGVSISMALLANVIDERWLELNGSPWPQDRVPTTFVAANYRVLSYRWISHYVLEETRPGGIGHTSGRLNLSSVSSVLQTVWPKGES
jgi:hypothetical protein